MGQSSPRHRLVNRLKPYNDNNAKKFDKFVIRCRNDKNKAAISFGRLINIKPF